MDAQAVYTLVEQAMNLQLATQSPGDRPEEEEMQEEEEEDLAVERAKLPAPLDSDRDARFVDHLELSEEDDEAATFLSRASRIKRQPRQNTILTFRVRALRVAPRALTGHPAPQPFTYKIASVAYLPDAAAKPKAPRALHSIPLRGNFSPLAAPPRPPPLVEDMSEPEYYI
eukprot:GGOE01008537.1.p1 GENE.GGOE01008537.1~~GGOE01008537.1.p1  ORF type:complete len:198 (-),score=35.36 GGOE01008537.1:736-1248(-)